MALSIFVFVGIAVCTLALSAVTFVAALIAFEAFTGCLFGNRQTPTGLIYTAVAVQAGYGLWSVLSHLTITVT